MAGREQDTRREGATAELSGFTWTPDRFNERVRAATPMPRAGGVPSDVISLAYGMPDPALFPAAGLAEAAEEALARRGGLRGGPPVRQRGGQSAPPGGARAKARGRGGAPRRGGEPRDDERLVPGDRARGAGAGESRRRVPLRGADLPGHDPPHPVPRDPDRARHARRRGARRRGPRARDPPARGGRHPAPIHLHDPHVQQSGRGDDVARPAAGAARRRRPSRCAGDRGRRVPRPPLRGRAGPDPPRARPGRPRDTAGHVLEDRRARRAARVRPGRPGGQRARARVQGGGEHERLRVDDRRDLHEAGRARGAHRRRSGPNTAGGATR